MLRLLAGSDRADPLALDDRTAERLLSGGLGPADVPPAYAGVARVLAAAAAQPSADELTGEAAAVTRLQAVVGARSAVVRPARAARARKRLQVKAAVAVVVGALAVSGIAGASGLGEPIQRAAQTALAGIGIAAPATETGGQEAANAGPTPSSAEQPAIQDLCHAYLASPGAKSDAAAFRALSAAAGGTDKIATYCQVTTASTATNKQESHGARAALQGLCRAYVAGQGGQHGARTDAAAFRALAAAAGGADNIATYCQELTSGSPGGQRSGGPGSPGASDDRGRGEGGPPPTTGGRGQGRGQPPGRR